MQTGQINEINLSGNTWIAADIHLGEDIPLTANKFYGFLAQARLQTQNLILGGDIFDSWIGDDNAIKADSEWLQKAIAELQQTAQQINLFLMPGNRDFLIGDQLAKYLGANLIESPSILISQNHNILLAHGDEYCLDDKSYQRFRKIVRNRCIQKIFLLLPLALRKKIAAYARATSKKSRSTKTQQIMDVNNNAIKSAMTNANVSLMVHGHTHRPYIHEIKLDKKTAWRYVLPDWDFDHDERGGWVSLDSNGLNMHYLPANQTATN